MAVTTQEITDRYALYNGDSCEVLPTLPDNSVHMSVYSPPFAELYNYSSSPSDLSNCASYEQFLEHYEFIVREIARVTKPGRMTCMHAMDTRQGGAWHDFPGDIIRLHEKHGFHYHSKHVIWKEPLRQAIKSRAQGLMHKQIVKDATKCYAAAPDYLIVMRKRGTNPEPVTHPKGMLKYAGSDQPNHELVSKYSDWKDPRTNKLAHYIWQRYASSVWMDIRPGRLLPYREAKESEEEKHVCPLQLDVIERCITLWSNPGDVILTPFLGIGSEAYCALKAGRRAVGIELKPSYFRQASRNIRAAILGTDEDDQPTLKLMTDEPEELDEDSIPDEVEES